MPINSRHAQARIAGHAVTDLEYGANRFDAILDCCRTLRPGIVCRESVADCDQSQDRLGCQVTARAVGSHGVLRRVEARASERRHEVRLGDLP